MTVSLLMRDSAARAVGEPSDAQRSSQSIQFVTLELFTNNSGHGNILIISIIDLSDKPVSPGESYGGL